VSKCFSCLLSHLKRQHIYAVERKNEIRVILECDLDVFMAWWRSCPFSGCGCVARAWVFML